MTAFDFDADGFARDAVNEVACEFQETGEHLLRSHEGQRVEQVKMAPRSALRGIDVEADANELQEWSEAISEGTRIVAEVG